MEFEEVIRKREAVRKYQEKEVPQEVLDKILEAGRLAPTAKNLQPYKVYVIKSAEGLAKIDEASPCRYGAPVCLLVAGDKSVAFSKVGHSTYEMDSCIVATHMMLEAANLGLGSIWIEMFDPVKIKELFSLPEEMEPIMLMPLGYTDETYPGNPHHHNRKPIEELVEYR